MNFEKLTEQNFMNIDFARFLSPPTKIIKKSVPAEGGRPRPSVAVTQLCIMLQVLYEKKISHEALLTKNPTPYIIGVNGSVSSGKSYTAKKLRYRLKHFNPHLNIGLLSTDNFLYSNEILKKNGIMEQKGFTPSYDWKSLFITLEKIKTNKKVKIPYYSQDLSDIDSTKTVILPANLNILIIEGINLLKTCKTPLLLSDFIDYSIYIETSETNLKSWFYKRLLKKKKLWKEKKTHQTLTSKNYKDFYEWQNNIWDNINRPNLVRNIYPFRYRSDLIIQKDSNHNMIYFEFKL